MRQVRRLPAVLSIAVGAMLAACSTSGSATNPRPRPVTSRQPAATPTSAPTTVSPATTRPQTTTAGPTTRPQTTAAPTTASQRPDLTGLVGEWDGHGRHLTVDRAGHFEFVGRTYVVCGEGPPPCDRFVGNEIGDGAVANGVITSRRGNIAIAEVTSTNDTDYVPHGTASFVYDPANDTLTIQPTDVSLCGPSAGTGVCGA